jgi:hypothetical protein
MNKEFKKALKYLNGIPDINRGGCGISALALYDIAKANGKKPKIVYLYSWMDDDSYQMNERYKKGKSGEASSCAHVLVKVGKKYYDSTGSIKAKEIETYSKVDEGIKRNHLIASIKNVNEWNPCFKRKKWLPKIKKELSIKFK